MRISLTLMVMISLSTLRISAQQLIVKDSASSINFEISNLGIRVDGSFKGLNGNIWFDDNNLSQSFFNVSVEATTIDTGIALRNKHLKKEEYFHVTAYPRITFISNSITRVSGGQLQAEGNLKIKNTTRKIVIPFVYEALPNGYLFEGKFKLHRRDFNVGGYSLTLSDEVLITLTVTAIREN
jgi:polyisoprenoid-binding protein YceI